MAAPQVVDLCYSVRGREEIPAEHGPALLAAIARTVSAVHGDEAIGIHRINGRLVGERKLELTQASRLRIRLPAGRIGELLPLAGKTLVISGARLRVGLPSIELFQPATSLTSWLVIIKGYIDAGPFLEAAQTQLQALGIAGEARLRPRHGARSLEGTGSTGRDPYVRRTVRIHGKTIVGYAVDVTGLSAADSLQLQASGIGGRRRFGCGIFVPLEAR